MSVRTALLAATLIGVITASAAAQDYEHTTGTRRASGESSLTVHVSFAVGTFLLSAAPKGQLYRADLTYDADKFTPTMNYDGSAARLDVGVDTRDHDQNIDIHGKTKQRLDLRVDPDVPLDLELELGAARTDVDLGGLTLTRASFKTGASDDTLRVSSPTRGSCGTLSLAVGAAEFHARQLGNARCDTIDIEAGAGSLDLDFTGDWVAGTTRSVKVQAGLAKIRLVLPKGVGVRLHETHFLASVDLPDFIKRNGDRYSANYDSATTHLNLDITTTLGAIEVDWAPGAP